MLQDSRPAHAAFAPSPTLIRFDVRKDLGNVDVGDKMPAGGVLLSPPSRQKEEFSMKARWQVIKSST
jgi:hypothetical protein